MDSDVNVKKRYRVIVLWNRERRPQRIHKEKAYPFLDTLFLCVINLFCLNNEFK